MPKATNSTSQGNGLKVIPDPYSAGVIPSQETSFDLLKLESKARNLPV
jgi:hypothetical protein